MANHCTGIHHVHSRASVLNSQPCRTCLNATKQQIPMPLVACHSQQASPASTRTAQQTQTSDVLCVSVAHAHTRHHAQRRLNRACSPARPSRLSVSSALACVAVQSGFALRHKEKGSTMPKETKQEIELTHSVAVAAAKRYLYSRGYDICENPVGCDIIAIDSTDTQPTLVVCSVVEEQGKDFGPECQPMSRSAFENCALGYMVAHPDETSDVKTIRCDTIQIVQIDGGRGVVKHHVNALSNGCA